MWCCVCVCVCVCQGVWYTDKSTAAAQKCKGCSEKQVSKRAPSGVPFIRKIFVCGQKGSRFAAYCGRSVKTRKKSSIPWRNRSSGACAFKHVWANRRKFERVYFRPCLSISEINIVLRSASVLAE